jgi:hypothetical protein
MSDTDGVEISGHVSMAMWVGEPEPDVWWGNDGIDAPIWADGQFYGRPIDVSGPLEDYPRAGRIQ